MNKAGTVSGEKKAEIIDMLGRRGDKLAIGFITGNLNDASSVVREDAIEALTPIAGKEAVPVLLNHLEKGTDIEAAKKRFVQLLTKNTWILLQQSSKNFRSHQSRNY
jgi:HEAT repeat protein